MKSRRVLQQVMNNQNRVAQSQVHAMVLHQPVNGQKGRQICESLQYQLMALQLWSDVS